MGLLGHSCPSQGAKGCILKPLIISRGSRCPFASRKTLVCPANTVEISSLHKRRVQFPPAVSFAVDSWVVDAAIALDLKNVTLDFRGLALFLDQAINSP